MTLIFDEKPYQGKLGGYFQFARPFVGSVANTTNSTSEEDPKKQQKNSESTAKTFTKPSSSRSSHQHNLDDFRPDAKESDYKPLSDMSLDELMTEKNQLEWVDRNIGGALSQQKKGNDIGLHHVGQSALNTAFPLAGIATGIVSMISDSRLDEIKGEVQSRYDRGMLSANDLQNFGLQDQSFHPDMPQGDEQFLYEFLTKSKKTHSTPSKKNTSTSGSSNDFRPDFRDNMHDNLGVDRDGNVHGRNF